MHDVEPYLVEPRSARYQEDWLGTAEAEDSMIEGSNSLREMAGLSDEWMILAIDITGLSHGEPPGWTVHVYAADRTALGVEKFEDWERVAADHTGIPVVCTLLHDVSFEDVVRAMKGVSIQLRRKHVREDLVVTRLDDHPVQE